MEKLFGEGIPYLAGNFRRLSVMKHHNRNAAVSCNFIRGIFEKDLKRVADRCAPELFGLKTDSEESPYLHHFLKIAVGMNTGKVVGIPELLAGNAYGMEQVPFAFAGIIENARKVDPSGRIGVHPSYLPFKLDGFHGL
jgi:hypothetical protein